jgi:transcriptional regulator with GAF, ATPase, and Fis domain
LPASIRNAVGQGVSGKSYRASVRRYKRQLVLEAIEKASGNMTGAARELGVNPCYLHRLMHTLGLRN